MFVLRAARVDVRNQTGEGSMKTIRIDTASDDQIYWGDGDQAGEEMSGEAMLFVVAPDGSKIPIRISFESGWCVRLGVQDGSKLVQAFRCTPCEDTGLVDASDQETEVCPKCKGNPWVLDWKDGV